LSRRYFGLVVSISLGSGTEILPCFALRVPLH